MGSEPQILYVGDTIRTLGFGDREVIRIDICLRPTEDPKAESYFAMVQEVELGEHGPPIIVGVEGGNWLYGIQVLEIVGRGEHYWEKAK